MTTRWIGCLLALALTLVSLPFYAADFPTKPVRLIVPFPPGGTLDIVGRVMARKLQDEWSQPVVVENRAGASGAVGMDYVAKSTPDGYTLVVNSTPVVTTPHLQKLPYDQLRDLIGVAQLTVFEYVLVASPKTGATTFRELIELAQQRPGQLNYSSAGNGSGQHLFMELVKEAAKINLTHVPYKGSGAALQAVVTGEVDLMFEPSIAVIPLVHGGKIRPLLSTGSKPLPALTGVPTLESLYPGIGIEAWNGIFAPSATPPAVVEKLAEDIHKAVLSPEVATRFRELGFEPTGAGPSRFNEIVRRDLDRWGKVIRDNNIRAD